MSGLTPLVGKNKTLTDRTWIWANILPEVLQRPILGTGYGAFWITETTEEYTVNEAHNGYLEVVMELGFVGLIINAIVIVSIALKAQRSLSIDYYWGAFGISYIFILLFYNITESSIQSFTNHLMALILFYTISNKSGQLIKLLNLNKPF